MSPTSAGGQRSRRDRPAKPPLSEAAIVDAALEILRSDGLEAVTMRRVAAALDTGAGSLYVYISGRDALRHAMQERLSATVRLETPDPARWRAQLHGLLGRMRRTLSDHPGIAAIAMAEPPQQAAGFRLVENLLGLLLAGGFEPQDAAWGADVLAALVTHSAIESSVRRGTDAELVDEVYGTFSSLPADTYPLLTAHARQLVAGSRDERFRFAVDVVLDGLQARAAGR